MNKPVVLVFSDKPPIKGNSFGLPVVNNTHGLVESRRPQRKSDMQHESGFTYEILH